MSLANLLKYIEAITLLLPLIEKIVSIIEEAFKRLGGGQGAVKKAAALELAKASLSGAGLALPDEVIGEVVDSVVAIKNQVGEFVSGSPRGPPV